MAEKQAEKTGSVGERLSILWRYSAGFRGLYLFAMFAQAGASAAKTGTFYLLGFLVDRVVGQTVLAGFLPILAAGIIGLALAEGLFSFLSGRSTAGASEGVARRLRNTLYDHIQHLPFSYHDRMPTGELIQRSTSDVDAVRRFFADQAIGVVRIGMMFLVNLTALLFLNPKLGLASILVVPFIVAVSIFFFRRVSKVYDEYQDQDAVLSTILQENLAGVRVVRAFAQQGFETAKFEKENTEKFRRGRALLLMHALFWPSTDILCAAQVLAGFTLGAVMAIQGEITLGQYIAYTGMVVYLIWPMRDLGRLVVHASNGLVSAYRTTEILRQPKEDLDAGTVSPSNTLRGEVEFRGVGFEYRGQSHILQDISFRCAPGRAVALLGPTGSGKTSLVNLLPRFHEYTSGRVLLDGVELREYSKRYLRRQIGIVEQEPFLFSRTIRENIVYGVEREVGDSEVVEAAQAAAIHEVILGLPDGYRTMVGEKGVTLSGGQRQRIAIARALLKDPRLLILDDSTSSVDSETEAEIRQALERLMQGRTTFIIAHRVQSVMRADLILVLDKGRIIQSGTHAELMEREGFYRRIFSLQSRIEEEVEGALAAEAGGQAGPLVA
ncbi:MAG: ABC transporter ATP-binding protein [Anaerolineales bacterium]|nr:ABC transporter ATP-binding protein [Anaerolineales bacterium]